MLARMYGMDDFLLFRCVPCEHLSVKVRACVHVRLDVCIQERMHAHTYICMLHRYTVYMSV